MKTNSFHQMVTETLETCLAKMSKKLQENFDPEDKLSIKLLQQYRSTISTWRSWMKQTAEKVELSIQKIKNAAKSTFSNKTKNKLEKTTSALPYDLIPKSEREKILAMMKHPSGLDYSPTKA